MHLKIIPTWIVSSGKAVSKKSKIIFRKARRKNNLKAKPFCIRKANSKLRNDVHATQSKFYTCSNYGT